jgi:hypothetical protein
VAGCCECGDETSDSGATELFSGVYTPNNPKLKLKHLYRMAQNSHLGVLHKLVPFGL